MATKRDKDRIEKILKEKTEAKKMISENQQELGEKIYKEFNFTYLLNEEMDQIINKLKSENKIQERDEKTLSDKEYFYYEKTKDIFQKKGLEPSMENIFKFIYSQKDFFYKAFPDNE